MKDNYFLGPPHEPSFQSVTVTRKKVAGVVAVAFALRVMF
jgi:hypothetical protein